MRKAFAWASIFIGAVGIATAEAFPIRVQFQVTTTSGPLVGQTASGTFTFDSSIIPAGGGQVFGQMLFSDLAFAWNGVQYTKTNTQTSSLTFDGAGHLVGSEFGTACLPNSSGCVVRLIAPGFEDWTVRHAASAKFFEYGRPDRSFGFGTERVGPQAFLDQQQPTIDASVGGAAIGSQKLAQVITAGMPGLLSEVSIPVVCEADLIVEVQEVTAGMPNGTVLTSETIPGSSLPPSIFPAPPRLRGLVFSAPVFFARGSQFAVVLKSAGICGVFLGPVGDSYLGGNLFFDSPPNPPGWVCVCSFAGDHFDLPFETWVRPYDRDADIAVYRGTTGEWFTLRSSDGGLTRATWGAPASSGLGDVPMPRDYDGDGTADLGVYRATTGEWFIRRSSDGGLTHASWGAPASSGLGDVPMPRDYDGDGTVDLAVYRTATGEWFIRRSSDGRLTHASWGAPASSGLRDVPVPFDYDGDGKTDLAVYRTTTGEWFILVSKTNTLLHVTWGVAAAGDVPVPADYDGDGRVDVAVYRGITGDWFISRSSDGGSTHASWGRPAGNDLPVPADYDADGKADITIYRGTTGEWFTLRSTDGGLTHATWGAPASSGLGDVTVPARFTIRRPLGSTTAADTGRIRDRSGALNPGR